MACDHAKCATPFCPHCGEPMDPHTWFGLLRYLDEILERQRKQVLAAESTTMADAEGVHNKYAAWCKLVFAHIETLVPSAGVVLNTGRGAAPRPVTEPDLVAVLAGITPPTPKGTP